MNTLTYIYKDKIYINLTNECSNNCAFCIRNNSDGVEDYYLWLDKKPTADEIIADLDKYNFAEFAEVVFCGFGEPLYALDNMLAVARVLKRKGVKTRVNTNGQADLIAGVGVAQKMKGLIDTVNISLNASDAEKYQSVCACCFGKDGYASLLRFAKDCVAQGIDTVLSVVDVIGADEVERCRAVAKSVGARYRVREYM